MSKDQMTPMTNYIQYILYIVTQNNMLSIWHKVKDIGQKKRLHQMNYHNKLKTVVIVVC